MDLDFLTEEVKKLARQTGEFLKKERLSFDRSRVEQKAAHDYVSYVDKASEKRIVERLHELLPEAGFIAGRTGILLGGGPLGRNEQLYSRLHAVLRKHCLAQPRGNTVGRSVRMRP